MELNDFQDEAFKYALPKIRNDHTYLCLGLVGEAGEVAEKIKKRLRGQKIESESIAHELGDVLWYLANFATALGYSLDEITTMNLNKLRDRKQRDVIASEGDNR